MQKAPATLVARFIIQDGLKELALLPVWWYTNGLKQVFLSTLGSMHSASVFFGLNVWVKNIFVPMYGETTFSGKAISFGVRLVVIVFRGIAVLVFSVFAWMGLALYVLILPVIIFFAIVTFLALLF